MVAFTSSIVAGSGKQAMISEDQDTNAKAPVPVFRFKLTEDVVAAITSFAKVHQYDSRSDYKDAWKEWCNENKDILSIEAKRLEALGYEGDIYDKFYKSGRYYFRTKNMQKQDAVERKKYVGLSREILKNMDEFILTRVLANNSSPAEAFNEFCSAHSKLVMDEIQDLLGNQGLTDAEVSAKLKKTFKNRYFQKVRKQSAQ